MSKSSVLEFWTTILQYGFECKNKVFEGCLMSLLYYLRTIYYDCAFDNKGIEECEIEYLLITVLKQTKILFLSKSPLYIIGSL